MMDRTGEVIRELQKLSSVKPKYPYSIRYNLSNENFTRKLHLSASDSDSARDMFNGLLGHKSRSAFKVSIKRHEGWLLNGKW